MENTIPQEAKQLRELKHEAKEADDLARSLKAEVRRRELALKERMEEQDIDGVKVDGSSFVPTETIYGQVQDRSQFVAWAIENAPELVEYKERGELINSLARETLDDNGEFPPGLGFRVKEYISVRAG